MSHSEKDTVPFFDGDLNEYAKQMCEYADKQRSSYFSQSVTINLHVSIFGPCGRPAYVAAVSSVKPGVKWKTNGLSFGDTIAPFIVIGLVAFGVGVGVTFAEFLISKI